MLKRVLIHDIRKKPGVHFHKWGKHLKEDIIIHSFFKLIPYTYPGYTDYFIVPHLTICGLVYFSFPEIKFNFGVL